MTQVGLGLGFLYGRRARGGSLSRPHLLPDTETIWALYSASALSGTESEISFSLITTPMFSVFPQSANDQADHEKKEEADKNRAHILFQPLYHMHYLSEKSVYLVVSFSAS